MEIEVGVVEGDTLHKSGQSTLKYFKDFTQKKRNLAKVKRLPLQFHKENAEQALALALENGKKKCTR